MTLGRVERPSQSRFPFQLRNVAGGRCLVAQTRVGQKGGGVVLRPCDPDDPEQVTPPAPRDAAAVENVTSWWRLVSPRA